MKSPLTTIILLALSIGLGIWFTQEAKADWPNTTGIEIRRPEKPIPLSIPDQIRKIAKEEHYQAPEFLVRLAECESRFDPLAKNPLSSARGLFQITDVHGLTIEQRNSVDFSTRWTIHKLQDGGAGIWVCTSIIS